MESWALMESCCCGVLGTDGVLGSGALLLRCGRVMGADGDAAIGSPAGIVALLTSDFVSV